MIIDEKVENIVLFASMDDICNDKLLKYWPNYRLYRYMYLSNIKLTALNLYVFQSYEIHYIQVQQNDIVVNARFFHFTNWYKGGSQIYPRNIISFQQLLQTIKHSSQHPILVHSFGELDVCAGLFILVHICIRQAQLEGHVDICSQVEKLRLQRPNYIDSVEEYLFAHLILLECITRPQHAYPCENFAIIYSELDDEKLTEEMRNILESIWLINLLRARHPVLDDNDKDRNRKQNIFPYSSCSNFLPLIEDDNLCYNDAIFVDGYQQLKKFIVFPHPHQNNVDDFWKIVMDNNVQLVISLQSEYHMKLWKRGKLYITPNGTRVIHLKGLESKHFHMHTLGLRPKKISGKYKKVKLIEVKRWDVAQTVPQNLRRLLTTRLEMNSVKCQEFSSILVMCGNGATASGLFVAMCNLLDCIECEHVVDVYTCVRNIRNSRRQFVTDTIQLRALFDIANLYLNDVEENNHIGTTTLQINI
ncbi:receptor-type tyrosine-protein phosphatase T-like [Atheta coriaria]|uniref:receptor-type tyrosine-protein phosphatase T-like n=1 Tax=Dalotia coriaria TaxID=877792 RepID=UPI0031F424E5